MSTATCLWGPFTRFGLVTALIVCVLDQALKLWLLFVFELGERGTVALTPFAALVLTWNKGISYGWFQQDGPFGQWPLLALKCVAVALLWIWLSRAADRLTALSLGLVVGGRSATASTGWPTARWSISHFSTSRPHPGVSIGTSLTSPM